MPLMLWKEEGRHSASGGEVRESNWESTGLADEMGIGTNNVL
jgi:hypothetical protein